ncbi:UNVERIFIED_ORG: hypothetical protein ABIC48_006632 [Burkholderia territorii]
MAQTAASAADFFIFSFAPGDFPVRRFHRAPDVIRQVSIAAIASALTPMPAIFTDPRSPRTVIRRDKSARRPHGQMQRKV